MDFTLQNHFHLGLKEFYLLYYLVHSEQQKMSLASLVPKVGLSHSALSRLVTRLEQHRIGLLVERQLDTNDKRSVEVLIKEKGKDLYHEMQLLINEKLQSQLSEKDIQNINRLFD